MAWKLLLSFGLCLTQILVPIVMADDCPSLPPEAISEECGCGLEVSSCFDDFCSRDTLTGDWLGTRTTLADRGITFQADLTQFHMGNTMGGIEQDFRYSGHGDYVTNIDMHKLVGLEGMFIKLRAEHHFGQSMAGTTGSWLPPNILANLPAESDELFLTDVLITQFLSESFAVFAGKTDTFDGDPNAFASGRGKTQFSNVGFVVNPALLRTVPYSALATGFVYLVDQQPIFQFTVINATDTATTTGLGKLFQNGVSLIAQLRVPTNLLDMPGHQLIGGSWSSREYVSLDQDPRIVLPDVPINRSTGSWALYYNFDQYLMTYDESQKTGFGVFGRAGIADESNNPISWFLSFGLGGNSPIASRQADTFGLGWYYLDVSNDLRSTLSPFLGNINSGQGVELYYNYEVTKWFHVTPDLQVLVPVQDNLDTALLVGVRSNITF